MEGARQDNYRDSQRGSITSGRNAAAGRGKDALVRGSKKRDRASSIHVMEGQILGRKGVRFAYRENESPADVMRQKSAGGVRMGSFCSRAKNVGGAVVEMGALDRRRIELRRVLLASVQQTTRPLSRVTRYTLWWEMGPSILPTAANHMATCLILRELFIAPSEKALKTK